MPKFVMVRTQFIFHFLRQWDCPILIVKGKWCILSPAHGLPGLILSDLDSIFLTEGKLEHIHLFVSRNKVFDKEDVFTGNNYNKSKKDKPNARKKMLQLLLRSQTVILII